MSLRELIDPECGGANPLMRLGNQIAHDAAHKDDGISGRPMPFAEASSRPQQSFGEMSQNQLVNEFLGQMSAPAPQSFRMDALLQEMREIDAQNYPQGIVQAPTVSAEVHNGLTWSNEFGANDVNASVQLDSKSAPIKPNDEEKFWQNHPHSINQSVAPAISETHTMPLTTGEFFDATPKTNQFEPLSMNYAGVAGPSEHYRYNEFMRFMNRVSDGDVNIENRQQTLSQQTFETWTDEFTTHAGEAGATASTSNQDSDWVRDFAEHKAKQDVDNEEFNKHFWNRLQDEWKKISDNLDDQSPWLSEFSEYYDPYKEYTFDEENPMLGVENVFEKGKIFLEQGDIPSAVLCFESAVREDLNNAEIWELLGTSQAENEKDPNAIAALKKSLELNPSNRNVMMALAISYTNESLQNQALRMLIDWLRTNEKYKNLVPAHFSDGPKPMNPQKMAHSLINGPELVDVQDIFIQAVQQSPDEIDAEIQEALGVLFNLSSDYEKAADCFKAALQVKPNSAKIWNRLGASLANGNQSINAVDAYQHALAIEPGYIRARYNVGIICINLKSYKEAIEHFLLALNHQATSMARSGLQSVKDSSNQMSDTIWSTLRMAISLMGRMDLQEAIDSRDLDVLNREFQSVD
ncbi:peroxisomal targeting signal 1 receptor [Contarinia nasturtii]|uniref:peroxisomal targeting signal 1 receptor n=1 Tax=Contarinia nasturtii TaxID=265458 RepID=UPI0012D4B4AF|nr:peroxisomal targeting signal 1 receptor [Contarinia nasturtii]XP_031629604.1 peroxisomal targeting signal 1 receptor [Contarinia nasturtii]XP_031629613.1 peroxisomal targeting signal 1 receptor [Contarinia nasturtii]